MIPTSLGGWKSQVSKINSIGRGVGILLLSSSEFVLALGMRRTLITLLDLQFAMKSLGQQIAKLLSLAFALCTAQLSAESPRDLVTDSDITEVHVLSQNWTEADATRFYNIAQGSQIIPYAWFLHLEQADSENSFRASDHIRALGYLPRKPSQPSNPDGLPIGFVKDGYHLGMTCAACHTDQINFKGEAWLVDGAPTHGDVATFQQELVNALQQTSEVDVKFERLAAAILGTGASPIDKSKLRDELKKVVAIRRGYNDRNLPGANAPKFGPGRVDALGAIMNEVSSSIALPPNNHSPANAPVSYPFLWDTPQHDKVEWNGAVPNTELPFPFPILPPRTTHIGALGRNTGEVLGVFGAVDAGSAGPLGLGGYPSSVNRDNLIQIEEMLRRLWSPQWPAKFGSIDTAMQLKGQQLFHENCAKCHDENFDRTAPDRRVEAKMDAVGTDQMMAANFATRKALTGKLQGRIITIPGFRHFKSEAPVIEMLQHVVQRVILGPALTDTANSALADTAPKFVINAELDLGGDKQLLGAFNILETGGIEGKVREVTTRRELLVKDTGKLLFQDNTGFDNPGRFFTKEGAIADFNLSKRPRTELKTSPAGTLVHFNEAVTVKYQYKGRPLNGVWATAPYLHNGSIPNLDELLKPPGKRIKKFKVGSREFDPVKVGFSTDQGNFEFDASLPGNSNAGHDYKREFSDQERSQLIEYIKSL
jgi:hypothetical protein